MEMYIILVHIYSFIDNTLHSLLYIHFEEILHNNEIHFLDSIRKLHQQSVTGTTFITFQFYRSYFPLIWLEKNIYMELQIQNKTWCSVTHFYRAGMSQVPLQLTAAYCQITNYKSLAVYRHTTDYKSENK